MDKELCLKYLEHLYRYSSSMLTRDNINEIDITYINNEVDRFLQKLDMEQSRSYDPANALGKLEKIPQDGMVKKAVGVVTFLARMRIQMLNMAFGGKGDEYMKRHRKISEFKERVRKIIAIIDFSG